jgi:16S rRNA (guanine966-N2)-methyltransferase
MARARKSLFDHLAGFLPDARVLDLFCGSGGLGLEALSRGAASAWFVDLSARSIDTARENAGVLGFSDRTRFIRKDVFRLLRNFHEISTEKFDLIFAAPPYRIAEPQKILDHIAGAGLLDIGGAVCLEYARHTPAPHSKHFILDRRKVYGETVIEVWDLQNGPENPTAKDSSGD